MKTFSKRFFAAAVILLSAAAYGSPSRCDVCGDRLRQKYWNYDGRSCCSQPCVDQLRPLCARCNQTIAGNYVESEDKIYCSRKCFEQTLPKCEICQTPVRSGFSITRHHYCDKCTENSPHCFSCGLPARFPSQLDDGREICNTCMRWSVKTQTAAQRHYERALRQLQAWTKLELSTVPKLKLINRTEMQELSQDLRKSDSPIPVRGLYSRQTFLIKKGTFGVWKKSPDRAKETIYIIDHLHDEVFRVAAMHELMHDLIHEHFPRLKNAPLWVHEGICQLAAAEYSRRRNYIDQLHGIETCKDPDYGDGYRYINNLVGINGWSALRRWMETVNVESIPPTAPE